MGTVCGSDVRGTHRELGHTGRWDARGAGMSAGTRGALESVGC